MGIDQWSKITRIIRGPARGGSHVARLNFKMFRVGVYKCLSLIVGVAVTVAMWRRKVVSCCKFILRAVATFWAMLLVRIYPGRASHNTWNEQMSPPNERVMVWVILGSKWMHSLVVIFSYDINDYFLKSIDLPLGS